MSFARIVCCWSLALSMAACDPAPGEVDATGEGDPRVLYGDDHRLAYYEASAPAQAAADSVVALVYTSDLTEQPDGTFILDTSYRADVCPTEYGDGLPNPAFCTGFLIDGPNGDPALVTAGHCQSQFDCDNGGTRFVFDFWETSAGTVNDTFDANDVYACGDVVAHSLTSDNDFSVIAPDRTVTGHATLPRRTTGSPSIGDALTVIGHPVGWPLTVAAGAEIKDLDSLNLHGNLDTYGGNSGSPIFNADWEVEAILVRGWTDFTWTGECYESNVCDDDIGCPGWEEGTLITNIDEILNCESDAFEPNEDIASAPTVESGTYTDLQVCSSDDDFFGVDLAAGAPLTATVLFSHADGDLDMRIVDAAGDSLGFSASVTDDESVDYVAGSSAETVYVQVYGFLGAINGYDLIVGSAPPPPSCTDDGYEDNDDWDTPALVVEGSFVDLMLCANDDDWYEVDMGGGETLTASIFFDSDVGDLDLEIWDNNDVVAISNGTSDSESAEYQTGGAEPLYVRVFGFLGAENSYDMDLSIAAGDTIAPTINLTRLRYNKKKKKVDARFTTDEPAYGQMCDDLGACKTFGTGTGHRVSLSSTGSEITIYATDAAGNTGTSGPHGF